MIIKVHKNSGSVRRTGYPAHGERAIERETSYNPASAFLAGSWDPREQETAIDPETGEAVAVLDAEGNPIYRRLNSSDLREHFSEYGDEVGGHENTMLTIAYAPGEQPSQETRLAAIQAAATAAGYDLKNTEWTAFSDPHGGAGEHDHVVIMRRDRNGILQGQGRYAEKVKETCRQFEKEHDLIRVPEHDFSPRKRSGQMGEIQRDITSAVRACGEDRSLDHLQQNLGERGLWISARFSDEGRFHGWRAGYKNQNSPGYTASELGFVGKDQKCARLEEVFPRLQQQMPAGGAMHIGEVPEVIREREPMARTMDISQPTEAENLIHQQRLEMNLERRRQIVRERMQEQRQREMKRKPAPERQRSPFDDGPSRSSGPSWS